MKILITTDCYTPTINGVVTSILSLESELRNLGHEVKILCPSENIHCMDDENVYRIGSVGINKIYSGARAAMRISQGNLQKLIDWKPDIIHSQSEFTSFIMAKKIAAAVGCPIVHTYHTIYENYTHYFSPSITIGRKAVIIMTKRILNHTDAVIAPSRKIEEMLIDYGIEQPIKVVPTGIHLEKFSQNPDKRKIYQLKTKLGIPLKSKVLITVGRAAKEKNTEELIRYFKKLDIKNTILLIVGEGPYLDTLKEIAEAENISEKVIFTGKADPKDIFIYYKLGDIFLSASQSETQGLTYIEALASGLPAVCRKDRCLDNVVTDGDNGGQYTSFSEFSKLIKSILENNELYKKMSENALKTAEKYSAKEFAKNAEAVYMEVLENRNHCELADAVSL